MRVITLTAATAAASLMTLLILTGIVSVLIELALGY